MSWAARRRFLILLTVGAVLAAFVAVIGIATFHETPTCTDRVQNQDEAGIDCGGSCPYLCTAEQRAPTVLFAKAVENGLGRTDIVASIENKNAAAAAKSVSYMVRLYGRDRVLLQEIPGTLDLPPSATVPIFIPGAVTGKQAVASVFVDFDAPAIRWYALTRANDPRAVPVVSNIQQTGTSDAPHVEAVLSNPNTAAISDVRAIIFVRDEKGEVFAASSTIVPSIPAQKQATAAFTWNTAFPGVPASMEVIPIIPLL